MRAAARAAGIDAATAMHLERQGDGDIKALGALRRYAKALGFNVRVVLAARREPISEEASLEAA